MPTFYEILEITPSATTAEIKSAYKRLALKYHPDRNPNNPYSEDFFKRVSEAYHTLADADKRFIYDISLQKPITPPPVYPEYTPPTPTYTQSNYHYQSQHYAGSYNPTTSLSPQVRLRIKIFVGVFIVLMFGLGAWGYWYMNVRNARLHFEQALSFYEQKEYRTAVMKIGFALEYDRAYADAFLLRAKINSEHFRNYFKAIEDYNWAIEGKRGALSQAELYYRRGWCYFKMYDFEVALEDFERAIKLDNANPRYRFFRAAMQAKTEAKSDRLCADLEGGLQIQIPEASEYLGMYCSKAQDKDNKRDTIQ